MDLRPGIPKAAQDAILKALSFEPEARYQKAREFGDELSWALVEDPDRTRPPSTIFIDSADPQIPSHIGTAAPVSAAAQANAPTVIGQPEVSTAIQNVATKRTYIFGGIAALVVLLGALVVGGLYYSLSNRSIGTPAVTTNPGATAPGASAPTEQVLAYWMTVQKMRNGKPDGDAFDSDGNIIYGNNWHARFNLLPKQAGSLYLLNEGPGEDGQTVYNILYPTPKTGAAEVSAQDMVQTKQIVFDKNKGLEHLWIIWSAQPLPDLKTVFDEAARTSGYVENPAHIETLKKYFALWQKDPPKININKANKRTFVSGTSTTLVTLLEMEHQAY
jgi:hypothetical protein